MGQHIGVESAFNGPPHQSKATVGEHVLKGDGELGIPRKDFACVHLWSTHRTAVGTNAENVDFHFSVQTNQRFMKIGNVSLSIGLHHESQMFAGQFAC